MNESATSPPPELSSARLLEMAYFLRLTRSLEERIASLFRQSKVIGGIYRSLGQEGESVASASALDFTKGDVVAPLIRNMGSMIVAGATPVEILRQYMAKGDGPSRGRDLNIHFTNLEKGYIGPISMLGDMVPVMAGIVLAGRMKKKNVVGMVYIGDGASSTGAFAEGINFATVQKLPLVIVIEDNGYAYSTPTYRQTASRTLADKAIGYGCAGETVDGNDVIATYIAAKRAVDRARSGAGVTLLEVKTFRMKGHAEHDNQSYVPKEVIEEWKARDPIERFESSLLQWNVTDAEGLREMETRIKRELDTAVEEAEKSPMPKPEEALLGVYHGDGYWDRPKGSIP